MIVEDKLDYMGSSIWKHFPLHLLMHVRICLRGTCGCMEYNARKEYLDYDYEAVARYYSSSESSLMKSGVKDSQLLGRSWGTL